MLEGPVAGGVHAWAPFFIIMEAVLKGYRSYSEQLDMLQFEKGLLIPDRSSAEAILRNISYYSLIGGYKEPFNHKPSGKYLRGVTFDEIYEFYRFDENLRSVFLKYILHVERHMKSSISYYFCEKHGSLQSEYLNPANFDHSPKNTRAVNRLIATMTSAVSLPSRYPYIVHHVKSHCNVPLWVGVNAMTFGSISAFYQYMSNDLQVKVSKEFPSMSEKQLHQMITMLAKCRNVCAHNERLYSFRTQETIPDTLLHSKLSIPVRKGQYICGKHDLFSIVIALRYTLSNEDFKAFKAELSRTINSVPAKCPHITMEDLLSMMGFPHNWKNISRYRKI